MNSLFELIAIYLLLSISLNYMWMFAKIFEPIRKYIEDNLKGLYQYPFLCADCNSFWCGILVSILFNPLEIILPNIISNIFCGLITHFCASNLYRYIGITKNYWKKFIKEDD